MKTVTADTILAQKSNDVRLIEKIIMYEQLADKISSVTAPETYILPGDYTSQLTAADIILVPFANFTTEIPLLDVSYNAGNDVTVITTDSVFAEASHLGMFICKKIEITDKLVSNGIDGFEQNIEGSSLFEFDSGILDFTVDNSTGYFLNKGKTGIFNQNKVFWVKYLVKIKGTTDEINWFGGLVDLTDMTPNFFDKTLTIRVYGHTYELTRYPAYNVIDTVNTELPKIGGMFITNYIASSDSIGGIKSLDYIPFSNSKMKEVSVESVSANTVSGMKVFEFRYPSFFRWNGGVWTSVATYADTTDGIKTLVGHVATETADIKFGDGTQLFEFPDEDTEIWVNVKDEVTPTNTREISDQGQPVLVFDQGDESFLKIHMQRILKLVGSTYTDITDGLNLNGTTVEISLFEANNDSVIFICPDKFYGIDLLLCAETFSVGSFEVYYSTGGDSFSAAMSLGVEGLVDGTNDLTEPGVITWNNITDWVLNNIVISPTVAYKGFMIKVKRITATGTCKSLEIKRVLRAKGIDNDFIEFTFDQSKLARVDQEDEVIVKQNSDGSWQVGFWHENVSLQYLLQEALNTANYPSGSRTISDAKIIGLQYTFNIWGKIPKNINISKPTAMCIDYTNMIIYAATVKDIYKVTLIGNWKFLTQAEGSISKVYDGYVDRMWLDGDELHYTHGSHLGSTGYLNSHYSYNLSTKVHTYYGFGGEFGKSTRRDGKSFVALGQYSRIIGDAGTKKAGENLCIPYTQRVDIEDVLLGSSGVMNYLVAPYPAPGIDGQLGGFPDFYYTYANPYYTGSGWNTLPYGGNAATLKMGFYGVQNNGTDTNPTPLFGMGHSFGSQGGCLPDGEKFWGINYIEDLNSDRSWVYCSTNLNNSPTTEYVKYMFKNKGGAPMCIAKKTVIDFGGNYDIWWLGFTHWYDDGDDTKSYSYITKFSATPGNSYPWNYVIHYSTASSSYTDITADVNSDTTVVDVFDSNTDAIYLCSDKKFRMIDIKLDSYAIGNTYKIQYYNGSTWVDYLMQNSTTFDLEVVSGDVPRGWEECEVVGGDNGYWCRIIPIALGTTGIDLVHCRLVEKIIWDSELDTTHQRYMPLWLNHDPEKEVLCGSMFNRESDLLDSYPFKWCVFILDLNNETIYFKHTGENFTFDGTMLPKDFVYDAFNNKYLFIFEDIRYKEKSAFLADLTYNVTTHAIAINQLGTPVTNEWGSSIPLLCNPNNGNIYGITAAKNYTFWEYAKEYYPRIELAKFEYNDTIFDLVKYISQVMNCSIYIHSERKFRMVNRGETNGTFQLEWNQNMIFNSPKIGYWKHFYDAVICNYRNHFDDRITGERKSGFDGWLKKVMTINNTLIQNPHIAKIVSSQMYSFYNNLRIEPTSIKVVLMPHIECLDKFNIVIPSKILDIDKDINFMLTSISLTGDKSIEISGLEIIS